MSQLKLTPIQLALSAVIFSAWCAYIFFLHPMEEYLFSDMVGYMGKMSNIVLGRTSPMDTIHPVGLPLILTLFFKLEIPQLFSLKCLYFVLVTGTVICSWLAALNWFGRNHGTAILVFLGMNFGLFSFSGFVMSEIPYAFALSVFFLYLSSIEPDFTPAQGLKIGALFALGLWFKGNHALFLPLLLLGVAYFSRHNKRKAIIYSCAIVIGAFAVLLPQGIYNQVVNGKFVLIGTVGGVSYYQAKCPEKTSIDRVGRLFQPPLYAHLGQGIRRHFPVEFYESGHFFLEGLRCQIENPINFLRSLHHFIYVFDGAELWPTNTSKFRTLNHWYAKFYITLLFPGILVGLILLLKTINARNFHLHLFPFTIFTTAAFFIGAQRYRVTFDIILIPIAVYGWDFLLKSLFQSISPQQLQRVFLTTAIGLLLLPVTYTFGESFVQLERDSQDDGFFPIQDTNFSQPLPRKGRAYGPMHLPRNFDLSIQVKPSVDQVPWATIATNHRIKGPTAGLIIQQDGHRRDSTRYLVVAGSDEGYHTLFPFQLYPERFQEVTLKRRNYFFSLEIDGEEVARTFHFRRLTQSTDLFLLGNSLHLSREFSGEFRSFSITAPESLALNL